MDVVLDTLVHVLQLEHVPVSHLVIEGLLILVLIWLFLAKRRPKQTVERLTPKEEQQLIDEWEPEPLVDVSKTRKMPEPLVLAGRGDTHVKDKDGNELVNMGSFNFLGFMGDEDIEEAAKKAIRTYGVGSCGPRGFYGTIDCHLDLEDRMAKFMNAEECILYSYGFSTIASVIPAYSKRGDIIFCDEGVTLSIQKGLVASRSIIKVFKHNDMDDLERLLKEQQVKDKKDPQLARATRRFIVVEGLYVNYGDICPLKKLVDFKYKYQCRLFVEESMSFGVLGKHGRGVTEHTGVSVDDIDAISVSMGNALGSVGGFCCGRSYVIDHQRLSGQGYCYSASLPPFLAISAIKALDKLEGNDGPARLEQLRRNIKHLHQQCDNKLSKKFKLSTTDVSPLVHVSLANAEDLSAEDKEKRLQEIVTKCRDMKVAITRAQYAPEEEMNQKEPSIRLAVTAKHTTADIEKVVEAIASCA